MGNDLLKAVLSETLAERAMQDIPLKKHSFSPSYRFRCRKNCKREFKAQYSYMPLKRMTKAAFIIILLSLLSLSACAIVQTIHGFTQKNYDGYSVLSPVFEIERKSITEFYWLPKDTGCKYLGREITYKDENISEVFSRYEYKGMLLTLWQTLPVGKMHLDTENGVLLPFEYKGLYGWKYDNNFSSSICWQQNGYMFLINVPDKDVTEKLIKDMEIYYG